MAARRTIRTNLAWLLLAAALLARSAAAGPFSQLIIFGDSLSDVGNISQATLGIVPGRYYHDARFSNGPVFTEALSLGLDLGPTVRSTAGGNNFAYGGAQTAGTGGFDGLFIRDIDEQVDQFLSSRTVDPSALFLVYAGANDLVSGGQTNVSVPVGNLAARHRSPHRGRRTRVPRSEPAAIGIHAAVQHQSRSIHRVQRSLVRVQRRARSCPRHTRGAPSRINRPSAGRREPV